MVDLIVLRKEDENEEKKNEVSIGFWIVERIEFHFFPCSYALPLPRPRRPLPIKDSALLSTVAVDFAN